MASCLLQCNTRYMSSVPSVPSIPPNPHTPGLALFRASSDPYASSSSTSSSSIAARLGRREFSAVTLSWFGFSSTLAQAEGLPTEAPKKLCDDSCESQLENIPTITTPSGLQYKDIVIGEGPSPPIGYQVAANYVAMIPTGQIFDSSLEKGAPYIFRVGAGVVIKGLDEGVLSMKVGGKRRLYVPGSLAFPKGLNAAAGRPRVLPNTPVIFDVSLEYIPGLSDTDFE